MNKRLISLMAAALALLSAAGGQVEFTGVGAYPVIVDTLSDNHTSLSRVFVVYNTDGVGMTYTATSNDPVVWQTYDSRGASYPEDISVRHVGSKTILDQVIPNKGYIITEGYTTNYYWVVNYADYPLEFNSLFFDSEKPCSLLSFDIDGQADAIPYYEVNGKRQVLDREIKLSYNNLVWVEVDSVTYYWDNQIVVDTFPALDQAFQILPPLCNTKFTLSGDRFLEQWGLGKSVKSDEYFSQSVSCITKAVQEKRNNNNEKNLDSGLGGSAPVHIVFTGYPTEAVVYHMWEMATDQDFEDIIMQDNRDELDYTFYDAGTYYLRYRVANADGTCEYYGETYTVLVSESQLECPNVFSPGSTEGVNDIWKVSYKSLVDFHCWIFNRWGNLVYEFTDPGDGWDGTYHGQLVDTGVYYYVITATGSDGVKYKRRGDITILRYKRGAAGTSPNGQGGVDTGGY